MLTLVHRYLGLTSAVFVLILSATGLLLNHTDDLHLDSIYVQNKRLLNWYGIGSPEQLTSFAVGGDFVTAVGEQLFRNTSPLEKIEPPLLGALAYRDTILVGSAKTLFVYTQNWTLIEKLDNAAGVPLELLAIGTSHDGQLVLRNVDGYLLADEDLLGWHAVETVVADWSFETRIPELTRQALLENYRGKGLPLERIMLDLHSGRLFGKSGVILVDAAAVLFLILAGSGLWLWARRRSR